MTKEQIRALALASGFQLKQQPDASMDLHPYVYEFARKLLDAATTPPAVSWDEAERVANLPAVDECLFNLVNDGCADNGTGLVRVILEAIKPTSPEDEPVGVVRRFMLETLNHSAEMTDVGLNAKGKLLPDGTLLYTHGTISTVEPQGGIVRNGKRKERRR